MSDATINMAAEDDDDAPLTGEFMALAMQADGLDGDSHATSAEGIIASQAETQAMDQTSANAREVRMILGMAVPILGTMFPSMIELWHDQQCDVVAASLAPVMTKYGISLGGVSDRPEFAALIVCGPLAIATYAGIKEDIAARKPQLPKGTPSNPIQAAPVTPEHQVIG